MKKEKKRVNIVLLSVCQYNQYTTCYTNIDKIYK